MNKPARYGIGDHVLYKGEECVVTDVDEDLRNDEEIYQVSRDSDKVDGLSFNDWVTWDDLEPLEGFTEEENNTMKFKKKVDERIGGGDSDEWVSMNDYVGEEFGESSLENELDKGDDGWTTIGGQPVGESKVSITPEMKKKIEEYALRDWRLSKWKSNKGFREIYELTKYIKDNKVSIKDDKIYVAGEEVGEIVRSYSSRRVDLAYQELKPKIKWYDNVVSEAKVVVDANDVWDVLELLDNEIANNELTDLINSHVRTEEEIMDAIDELCGETITKNELNTLLSGRMVTLVDYLGLDVEQYENMGNFVDSDKPTSVELESGKVGKTKKVTICVIYSDDGAVLDRDVVVDVPAKIATSNDPDVLYNYISDWIDHQDFRVDDWMIRDIEGLMDEGSDDDIQGGEVKDGEKQVTQDGETKTLVAGEDATQKPVCEMTIEQEIDDPWKLSEMLWSQGKENLEDLLRSELVGEEDIMMLLEDMELRNLTSINDAFAFDFESILDSLGLDGEAWSQNLEIKRKGGED